MACEKGVTIARIEGNPFIDAAKKSILDHKDIVDTIENLPADKLNQFLDESKVFTFSSGNRGIENVLNALSSFDGTRSYVLSGYVTQANKVPQQTLEHELMHNLSRWGKDDPRRISPSKNKNLQIDGHMVEAGDYYEFRVYQKLIRTPCPFCLSEVQRSPY